MFWSSRSWMLVSGVSLVLWITAVSFAVTVAVSGSRLAWMV